MHAFTKAHRLLVKNDYDDVFKHAKKIIIPEFIILFKKNNLGYSRLGLAISKKVIVKSHDRNRIKRMIRESFRLNALPAVDLVFLARHGVAKKTNSVLSNQLGKSWAKLNVDFEK